MVMNAGAAHLMPLDDLDLRGGVDDLVGEDCEAVFDITCRAIATTTRFVDGKTRPLCDDCAAAWDDEAESHDVDGVEPEPDEGEWDL